MLEVLRKRLDNDVTRMAALQAFSLLANSPLSIDLLSSETGVMSGSAVVDIANFLRQQNRCGIITFHFDTQLCGQPFKLSVYIFCDKQSIETVDLDDASGSSFFHS